MYKEIVPPERIVWVDTFSDADGNESDFTPPMLTTFNFIDLGDKTKLSATSEFASAEHLEKVAEMGMVAGLSESLDKLEELLAR